MSMNFIKNSWQVIVINLFILLAFVLGYGRFGDIIIDSFREAYIPAQVVEGKILYENIFTIYAPFAYMFNALLFKILGINLSVLYFAGLAATLGFLNLIYLISNKFIDKNFSLAVILFTIAGCVLSPNVFNFFFPYSYGMIYGLLFITASIYFGLEKKFPPAYLMYSFAVCSKYEFVFLLPLLIYVNYGYWKKDWLKNIICLILPFILVYTHLLLQGAELRNLAASLQIVAAMSTAKTLRWFYSVTGLIFRWELIPVYILNIVKIAVPFFIFDKFKTYWLLPVLLVYLYFTVTPEIIIFAFPLILVLFVTRYRKLNGNEKFFILASILISIKVFFALTLKAYGVYCIPFAMISIYILMPPKYKKALFVMTLLSALILLFQNTKELSSKNVKIATTRGIIRTTPYYGNTIREFLNYIQKNTSKNDTVLVYPEGLAVNFLSNRASDNKFYSLIPLYVETFGENLIMDRLYIKQHEYIAITNYDTSLYYYSKFGIDYAGRIMDSIKTDYTLVKTFGDDFKISLYRLKHHHPSP